MNGLKCIRKICNLSAEDIADILGVTRQAVSSWENGKRIPDNRLIQLSEYFGLQEAYFNEIGEKEKEELLYKAMVRTDVNGKESYRYRKPEDVYVMNEATLSENNLSNDIIDCLENCESYAFTDGETSLEEEYILAKAEKQAVLQNIEKMIEHTASTYRIDQICAIRKGCRRYGMINTLLEKQQQTQGQLKYLFGLELESVWRAMLLAYGLIEKSELHYRGEREWSEEDGKWVEELSQILKCHWENEVSCQAGRKNT